MNKASLKIGLDFHGVITGRPEYFAAFSQEARRRGHEIHIITGGPYEEVRRQLEEWKIWYSRLFAIYDYYDAKGAVSRFENGEYKVPDMLWDTAKAEYCSHNGINIHIDDSSRYVRWFLTPYCHYNASGKSCTTESDFAIDFTRPAAEALNEIEEFSGRVQFF